MTYMHPSYSCELSSDAGATVVKDGLTLEWDPSSDKWKKANWLSEMKFTYWIQKVGHGPSAQHKTPTVFNSGKSEWEPQEPDGSDGATTNISSEGLFTFLLKDGIKPPSDAFPYKMAFQFSQLASKIELCFAKKIPYMEKYMR